MAMEVEEPEQQELQALFHPSPPAYYVQSPSAASHTLSHPSDDARSSSNTAARLTLSRYSSSRGSSHSFLLNKRSDDRLLPGNAAAARIATNRQVLRIVSLREHTDGEAAGGGIWRYVTVDADAPCCCVVYQAAWRAALCLALATAVFVLATKPDPPDLSLTIGGMEWFSIGEGLDGTGVETAILDLNSSVRIQIDNNSKLFPLHVDAAVLEMSFATLKLAAAQGEEAYVERESSLSMRLFLAASGEPVYAAGRRMQELLESGEGAPVSLRAGARSVHRVLPGLVELSYDHRADCSASISRVAGGGARFFDASCSASISF